MSTHPLSRRQARRETAKQGNRSDLPLLARLGAAIGKDEAVCNWRCAADLMTKLTAGSKALSNTRILAMFGGGKDSSFMVAALRYQQLLLRVSFGETFKLRIATFRHPGMAPAVLANIHRVYDALRLYGDPDVELLLIDGDDVVPFDLGRPFPDDVRRTSRTALLMGAHRSGGDARASFCDACNLGMTRSFRVAAAFGGPVDLIVTGDSASEQRRYAVWTKRAAERFRTDRGATDVGLGATLDRLEGLHKAHNDLMHGPDAMPLAPLKPVAEGFPEFFSLYDYMGYDLGSHRRCIEEFLGFEFDPTAWVFTESDCGNPAIMACMRGLVFERLRGRSFAEGFREYCAFALELMRRKDFPGDLIARMAHRVSGEEAVAAFRADTRRFLRNAFDLEEDHLIAALFSPFTDEGARLDAWLAAEVPTLADRAHEIRDIGAGREDGAPDLLAALIRATALDLGQIRHLWRCPLTPNLADPRAAQSALAFVRLNDPHKATINSPAADGSLRREVLTGR